MPPTVALAPVRPTGGDGRLGAALSHIGGESSAWLAVILKIIGAELENYLARRSFKMTTRPCDLTNFPYL
jgi:hypothetical protein